MSDWREAEEQSARDAEHLRQIDAFVAQFQREDAYEVRRSIAAIASRVRTLSRMTREQEKRIAELLTAAPTNREES